MLVFLLSPSTQINPMTGSIVIASDTVVGNTVLICIADAVSLFPAFRGDANATVPLPS